ncbi:caspase family protein [Reichenbachiella carrageenanivorans]|uniref:Caspase family protein n=1 Tax=Reichenbachiella carrageenanivorans TaxID=2979869 RepID=A0ABY6D0L8_9BACT|nr:caspase family protein [Reichenbachiella carrageenanivorans]UXX79720.1 caspase family protein [Reichenbachiella carrageenanivorans]
MQRSILFILTFFICTLSLAQNNNQLIVRQGHTAAINSLKYAPDGSAVYSASDDKSIKMWDVKTGVDINTFNAHTSPIQCMEISNDGRLLVSGDLEGKLLIWDAKTGENKLTIQAHEGSVNTVKFTKDQQYLVSGGDDNMLKVWNLKGDTLKTIKGFNAAIKAIGISPDGTRLISGGYKNNGVELLLVDLQKGKIIDDVLNHWKGSAAAQAYAKTIMTPIALAMNLAKGNVGKGMATFYIMNYSNIEFTNDGSKVLISQNTFLPLAAAKDESDDTIGNSIISIIELSEDKNQFTEVMKPIRWQSSHPRAVALFNQDQTKVIVNEKFSMVVYDIENADFPEPGNKEATQYVPPVVKEIKGTGLGLNSLAMSPDYRTVVSADDDRKIKLWDYNSGRKIRDLEGFVQPALAVDVLPDGQHIMVGSLDRNLTVWDITTGQLVRTFDRSSDVCSIDIAEDGKSFLTASVNTEFFKMWNFTTGRQLRSFLESKKQTVWVKYAPDDNDEVYAATADGEVKIWSISESKAKKKLKVDYETLEDKYQNQDYTVSWDDYTLKVKKGQTDYFSETQSGRLTDAVFSKDGKYLISTNENGEIAMYELAGKKRTATMALIGNNDFITYTPDLYYTSSKAAANAIAFKSDNKILPFEQLELKYNRPDLVASRIGYAPSKLIDSYKAAYDRRLKRLGYSETDLGNTFDLPEVKIDYDNLPLETNQKTLTIKVVATDKNYPIQQLQVYANDVPVFGSKGMAVSPAHQISQTLSFELGNGLNEIKITATNTKGQEAIPEKFDIQYTAEWDKPDLYIVSIGVSEYQQADYNLAFAAKDAQDIVQTLSGSSAYEKVYTKLLINANATDANIMAVRSFVAQAKVDDIVAIFIAGHGVLDQSYNYYFATNNIDFNNPASGGLSYGQIETLIDGIPCRNKILLMDTCHSGELDDEDVQTVTASAKKSGGVSFRSARGFVKLKENSFGLQNTLELSKSLFGDLRKGTGATVISAAGGTEFAAEGLNSANGLFTASFIEGITTRRADTDRNRSYTISEMRKWVGDQVTKKSKGNQVPTSREENVKNDFRIY